MALKHLKLENFRGRHHAEYDFHNGTNLVRGRNASGKTTIREAIIFGFCGTDSIGAKNPQHLISKDADNTKVTIVTDKAELHRTLTRKGNGTLKLIRNGMPTTLSQSQLEGMIGSIDLFLSSFVPGYFLRLTPDKQHRVISEVRPKIDRVALFEKLAGFALSTAELSRYSLDKRIDSVLTTMASDRRELEKGISVAEGKISTLRSIRLIPEPTSPLPIDRLNVLRDQWNTYNLQLGNYNLMKTQLDRIVASNSTLAEKKQKISSQLAGLKVMDVPEAAFADITDLQAKLQPMPEKPALMTTVDTDRCLTCGQTVGLQHRERVKKSNEEAMAEFDKKADDVREHNKVIEEEINKLNTEYERQKGRRDKVIEENNRVERMRMGLEMDFAGLNEQPLPNLPPLPEKPGEVFDEAEYKALKEAHAAYDKSKAEYDYVKNEIASREEKVSQLQAEMESTGVYVQRLRAIEANLKKLPAEEMKMQSSFFEDETTKIYVEKEVSVFVEGIPYGLLSTGQRMRTDVKIAEKFNSMMAHPINMLFLDDADLIDEQLEGRVQFFVVGVDAELSDAAIMGG